MRPLRRRGAPTARALASLALLLLACHDDPATAPTPAVQARPAEAPSAQTTGAPAPPGTEPAVPLDPPQPPVSAPAPALAPGTLRVQPLPIRAAQPRVLREHATLVALNNGDALLIGGETPAGPSRRVERWTAAKGEWTEVAPMAMARIAPAAVHVLHDEVLVTGGRAGGPSPGGELYMPVVNRWRTVPELPDVPGSTTTLTPARDSRVLAIIGERGLGSNKPTQTLVWDPGTRTVVARVPLLQGRFQQAAMPLSDGRMMVLGGLVRHLRPATVCPPPPPGAKGRCVPEPERWEDVPTATTEIYDLLAKTWTAGPPLPGPRAGASAELLADGTALVVGGRAVDRFVEGAALWLPERGQWSPLPWPTVRAELKVAQLGDGGAVVVSGDGGAWLWRSKTRALEPLPASAALHPSPELVSLTDGSVLLAGPRSVERLLPSDLHAWRPGDAPLPRTGHTVTLLADGRLLVVGGRIGAGATSSVQAYEPKVGAWQTLPGLLHPRADHRAVGLRDGRVLVVGGEGGGPLTTELWEPRARTWTAGEGTLPAAPAGFSLTLLGDGRVLLVRGATVAVHSTAELWDPATASWSSAGALIGDRSEHSATLLRDGRVFVAGGRVPLRHPSSPGQVLPLDTTELFDPATRTWSQGPRLFVARRGHAAEAMADGSVLVVGGSDRSGTPERFDPLTRTVSQLPRLPIDPGWPIDGQSLGGCALFRASDPKGTHPGLLALYEQGTRSIQLLEAVPAVPSHGTMTAARPAAAPQSTGARQVLVLATRSPGKGDEARVEPVAQWLEVGCQPVR